MRRLGKRIRRALRDLSGRGDSDLVAQVHEQLEATHAGAELALAAVQGKVDTSAARQRMGVVEHRGDDARGELVALLRRSISSPIDREDLFRLSRAIDDVLDELRDFVRGLDLLSISDDPVLAPPLEAITEAVVELEEAVALLVRHPKDISQAALSARKNAIRERYLEALAVALEDEQTGAAKRQELLRRLDVAGQRLGNAADVLSDAAMKRWFA